MARGISVLPAGNPQTHRRPTNVAPGQLKPGEIRRLSKKLGMVTVDANKLQSMATIGDRLAVLGALNVGRGLFLVAVDANARIQQVMLKKLEQHADNPEVSTELLEINIRLVDQQINLGAQIIRSEQLKPDREQRPETDKPAFPPPSPTLINAPGSSITISAPATTTPTPA